jgi:hypothetical protein
MTIAEMLCETAKVARYGHRLFCIGPNVGRINFLSQQIRALNLVWALHTQGHIAPNHKVAVIGGGIAGITAAVALRAYDCTVRVFDQGARPMHRQSDTKHRHIFPNLNWWPQSERELAITTALPFLDWHIDQCDRVIDVLDSEWTRLAEESGDDLRFHGVKTINRAEADEFNEGRLTLKSVQNEEWKGFDTVLVATGFGEERKHLDIAAQSYWSVDELSRHRDGREPKVPIIVSGFGDGGQIDALRVAYARFGDGMLTFKVSRLIQTTPLLDRLAETERQPTGSRDYPALARLIADDGDYEELRHTLDGALYGEDKVVAIVTDSHVASPYDSPAAPIHKLLLAYAHHRQRIGIRIGGITASGRRGVYRIGGDQYDKKYNHFVIRHGASTPDIPLLINDEEWEALAEAQKRNAAFSFKPAWPSDDPPAVPDGWPCPTRTMETYIASRKDLARRAMQVIGSPARVDPYVDRFIVYGHEGDFRPTKLFGMPVDYRDTFGPASSAAMD